MRTSALLWVLLLSLICLQPAHAQQVREYLDLQTHPIMLFPHRLFTTGLEYFDPAHPPKLSYNHQLTNVNYANYLQDNKGARIISIGLIVPELFIIPRRARKMILREIAYVEDFVAQHPDKFVIAHNPREVRINVETTDKTVIIYSVEGAEKILDSQEDADFWASKGISFMTLIHLIDCKFGGAATLPMIPTQLINFRGTFRSWFKQDTKGLTDKGRQAILWLANAGIMTDITHMSPHSRQDALNFMEQHHIPPISTHEGFQPIQNNSRALTPEQITQIYRSHGLMSLAVSLSEYNPYPEYQRMIDSIAGYCPSSVDSYKFTYEIVKDYIESNAGTMLGDTSISFDKLSEDEKVKLALGFQTDFNGWTNHARPRYGPKGCADTIAGQQYYAIETQGLAHPGLLYSQWQLLQHEGVDLWPIKRASERFLQLWEEFLDRKGKFE
jgi:microsomal dipeptidase-like Zn-dependent dipeptidase